MNIFESINFILALTDVNVFLSSQHLRHKLTKYNKLKYLFTYLFLKWE